MKKLLIVLFFLPIILFGQEVPSFNLDFEQVSDPELLPDDWFKWGTNSVSTDAKTIKNGKYTLLTSASEDSEGDFGCGAYRIPAKYKGSSIELTGFIKTENVREGRAGLLLRLDGKSGTLEFDNMESQELTGTVDWKKYSIKLKYPEKEAKLIIVGGILIGKGKAWFDDFDVLIDGVSINKLIPVEPELLPAQKDKEFDEGSRIADFDLTKEKISALALLGKTWGYVKYYHPKIATGDVNWDYELFRVLPNYLKADNEKQQAKIIVDWINQLGKFEIAEMPQSADAEIKLKPDLAWIEKINDDNLKSLLSSLKNAKRTSNHFYIDHNAMVGNPDFSNENSYKQFDNPDVGFRLLSLYRYWNIIQYYFPYRHLTDTDWNDIMIEFVPKFVNAKSELEYKLAALEIIGKVQDTHANIWQKDETLSTFWGNNHAPLKIEFVEEKPLVVDYYNDEFGKETGIEIDDIITAINGQPISERIKEMLPYTPASNYPTQLRNIARKILQTNNKTMSLTFLRNGKEQTKTITCRSTKQMNFKKEKKSSYESLDNEIGYIYPGSITETDITKIKKEFKNKKGIVIDLRCYPSTFMVFSFGDFLMPQPTDFVKFSAGDILHPGKFEMSTPLKVGSENPDYYKGKVAILINETSQSQAEYTTMAFRVAPQAKVFGSTTAGADGNVSAIYFPGNIRTMISGIGVYTPEGKETQRVGIIPDVEVKPTIKGKQNGKDEVLDKALEWLKE